MPIYTYLYSIRIEFTTEEPRNKRDNFTQHYIKCEEYESDHLLFFLPLT